MGVLEALKSVKMVQFRAKNRKAPFGFPKGLSSLSLIKSFTAE